MQTPAISFVPEYKPTPISKLKECTTVPVKASKSVYTPEFPVAVRKKKNVEEYDPTEVKCVPKKTVTFLDQTDTSTVPVILLSSEDELDDSENAPKFSDDDSEYEVTPISNSPKQVPDVITIKEEPSEEEKIDEFSVVDKILVDCKKNEILLSNFKKIPPKTNNISSKLKKSDKNLIVQPEKEEENKKNSNISIKTEKYISGDKVNNSSISSIKTEKNVSNSKIDCNSINKNDNVSSNKTEKNISSDKFDNFKSKSLRDEVLDLLNSPPKSKNSIDVKQVNKNAKKENKIEKEKKIGSHSNHTKEKLKKDSKGDHKHIDNKKLSHSSKTDLSSDKNRKSHKHSSSESSDKKESKKRLENHTSKRSDKSCIPSKKKELHENENLSKTAQPHIVKLKDKKSSNDNSLKRKSTLDSDFEKQSLKRSCLQEDTKEKSHINVAPKKSKVVESQSSDRSKLENNNDNIDNNSNADSDIDESFLKDLVSSSESDPDEECRRIFEEYYPEESENTEQNKTEVSK